MAYTITLDKDLTITPKDGFIIKDELNETLDSGTIVFSTFNDIGKEPFDSVVISGSLNNGNAIATIRQVIDSIDDTQLNFDSATPNHDYIVSIFSETKNLERITLPSIKITQSKVVANRHSVAYYIMNFIDLYCPQIRVAKTGSNWGENVYKYYYVDTQIEEKFGSIICPEFQWNNPTLREVLNDLMLVANCICVMKNNVISFYDLTARGNAIDKTKLTSIKSTQSSGDYVSELTLPMKNSIGKKLVRVCEYVGFRSTTGVVDTNVAQLILSKPIDKIAKVVVCFWQMLADTRNTYKEIDITRNILEENEFKILPKPYAPSCNFFDIQFPDPNDLPEFYYNASAQPIYQQYCAYFKRGSNTIDGLLASYRYHLDQPLIIYDNRPAICGILRRNQESNTSDPEFLTFRNNYRDFMFKVEYYTAGDDKIIAGKYLPFKRESRIFDNQTSSYVDPNQQSIFEYHKVNRLCNIIKTIQGTYYNETDVPKLGDTLDDDYILYSRELEYKDECIRLTGYCTKNYILRDYFTGVQAKRRSWQYLQGNEAAVRFDVDKVFCEFSFNRKYSNPDMFWEDSGSYDLSLKNFLPQYLLSPFYTYTALPIKFGAITTYDKNLVRYPTTGVGYATEISTAVMGNSLVLNIGFDDNVSAGNYVVVEDGNYTSQLYKYVDEDGECRTLYITFSDYVDPTDGDFTWSTPNDVIDSTQWNLMRDKSRIKPLINDLNLGVNVSFLQKKIPIYKDNGEIPYRSIQFEFCSDTPDILVKGRFIELQKAYNESNNNVALLRLYASTTETYRLEDTTPKGSLISTKTITTTNLTPVSATVYVDFVFSNYQSYCITDSNNNILVAVNCRGDSTKRRFYLNLLDIRDDNIYDNYISQEIVGSIISNTIILNGTFNDDITLVDAGGVYLGTKSVVVPELVDKVLISSSIVQSVPNPNVSVSIINFTSSTGTFVLRATSRDGTSRVLVRVNYAYEEDVSVPSSPMMSARVKVLKDDLNVDLSENKILTTPDEYDTSVIVGNK